MTVALTGTDSRADLPLPRNVRRYYFPGTTHGGDIDGGFNLAPAPSQGCRLAKNPIPETEQMNALQVALAEWVLRGKEPPASAYPTLRHKDLLAPFGLDASVPEFWQKGLDVISGFIDELEAE